MKLLPGCSQEYKLRHDRIWPELTALLKEVGISQYSIFLEEETNTLFAMFTSSTQDLLDKLPEQQVMKKWWSYMKDICESNPDNSPIITPLTEVFYLP